MYVFVAVFCQGSDRLAALPASNTMGKKIPPTGMPRKMLEVKLLCQDGNPGRAVTLEDIKGAPAKLRNKAMNAMVESLSLEQKYKYKRCRSDCERRTWVVEYMLDPAKVRCKGLEGSHSLLKAMKERRSEILEGIAVAKKRLSMAVCCCQRCAEIRMKSNQVTLIDAQLDNLSETEAKKRAIECEKESIGRNVRVDAEKA